MALRDRAQGRRVTSDEQAPIPIPPGSVVRVAYRGPNRSFRKQNGRVFRVGYYSRQDGLNCIWLVNDEGKYEQTVDHEFLYRWFDVISFAADANWYGRRRPILPTIRRAGGKHAKYQWTPSELPKNWLGRRPPRDS